VREPAPVAVAQGSFFVAVVALSALDLIGAACRYGQPVNYLAVAVAVIIASAVVAVLGFVVSIVRSRSRRLVTTGSDMPTDYGLVLLMIGLAGLISGLGVTVFLLLTT
jgi:hypothetical protein